VPGTNRRGGRSPAVVRPGPPPRSIPRSPRPGRALPSGRPDVWLGRTELRTTSLSGARRVSTVPGDQHADISARNRVREKRLPCGMQESCALPYRVWLLHLPTGCTTWRLRPGWVACSGHIARGVSVLRALTPFVCALRWIGPRYERISIQRPAGRWAAVEQNGSFPGRSVAVRGYVARLGPQEPALKATSV